MAEFKLGRLRFIWKGEWSSSTVYYRDDVIRNGGNTYICIAGHTSSALFSADRESYWNTASDGQQWRDEWTTDVVYNENDLVKYGGNIYIANTSHQSAATFADGLEVDLDKWDVFADGFDYLSNWQTGTRYKVNDLVKNNGIIYACVESHTSAATPAEGLEADFTKWEAFSAGLNYRAAWGESTAYERNDLVKFGPNIYICVLGHTSSTDFESDLANWNNFVEGIEYEDTWNSSTAYQPGDFVTFGGYSYIAKTFNSGYEPSEWPSDWELFTTGFRFRGDWGDDSTNQDYLVGDVVRLNGHTYLCIDTHNGQKPPNTDYWELLNPGFFWRDGWSDGTVYEEGDTVRFGENSYVCVQGHASSDGVNDPVSDNVGAFWNLFAAGAEESVLTTNGDILYYGGAGPTRLPIGKSGQILAVNAAEDAPEWQYWGYINNVYYVSTDNGLDAPAPTYGINIDQPWKTIRYASQEILRGPLNPHAKRLLFMNKSFIQAEVVEWIDYQVANIAGDFTGFTYNKTQYEQAIGHLVDGVMYDISHGGNEKSILSAEDFTTGKYATPVAGREVQTNAAIDYALTIINDILNNDTVATSWQVTNGVSPAISQFIDTDLEAETGIYTLVTNLITLSKTAITDNNTDNLPAIKIPNNTIFVKTGLYKEVLPIVVPQLTVVQGDELRSTRIEPAAQIVSSTDTPYTLETIEHLIDYVGDVVAGSDNITKTPSNTEDYVATTPLIGDSATSAEAADLMRQIYDYIDFGVNGVTGDSTEPRMDGSNELRDQTEYTYAVDALERNRHFLIEEGLAYIKSVYPAYDFDETKCRRDLSYYIDAIQHDLRYGGNYESLKAAKLYVNSVIGSLEQDMFYLRNATGLRNCTTAGLTGTLSPENELGTRRPSAGAYASLDPGWGPDHEDVWIKTRSPYVQNVTTFGTACIGMKVDGDLHNGGNDSIVANDFTQVLSDGIGAWVTNLGRAELVSVFSYYNYIGYLAENGGKIRATNGNNSYGTFGSVAEGIDETEVPVSGNVTNRSFDALIDNVFTDGNNILTFEYLNAGQNYTPAGTSFVVTGEGFAAEIDEVQVNDGGVFEVRLLNPDLDGDSEGDFGGDGFANSENVAQAGDTTTLTLSNTDPATSGQYTGMAVFLTSGLGAGQYGYIDSYNSGTKIAQIKKYSDDTAGWDHLVPGTAIEAALDDTTQYSVEPRISFTAPASGLYADTAKGRAVVSDEKIIRIKMWDPGTGYTVPPTMTVTDPNNTIDLSHEVRIADGVLAQPTWVDRGTAYATAEALVNGDGFMDLYQPGEFVRLTNLTGPPLPGSTITFGNLPGSYYKLVTVRDLLEDTPGRFSCQIQISPELEIQDAPEHLETCELRIRYSQVRLTGHDFLDIGTGNFADTNYPDQPLYDPVPANETRETGGGRVFYTSTDQDGNFRVGDLFSVEQSTGVATLNADAFNISGLQELSLGELALGGTGAVVTEFSADGTFTADSDNVVPTQKAIKTYITSQIGGGAGELNVNSLTAGQILITGQQISNVTGGEIKVVEKMNFEDGVDGAPVALNFFLSGQ